MSLWIKICGTTSMEDARLAVEAGADAVGFVFAPSPRRVTVEQVAGITTILPEGVEKIGVFVGEAWETIGSAVRSCGLTGVQLHSNAGAEVARRLKEQLGPELRVLGVVHFGPDASRQTAEIDQDLNVDAVLIDSRTALAVGGTGVAYDWDAAQGSIFADGEGRKRRIVAGGLTPANVAEAVVTLRPWGVDVVSGVESAPGRKDPDKVRAFMANARAASRQPSHG